MSLRCTAVVWIHERNDVTVFVAPQVIVNFWRRSLAVTSLLCATGGVRPHCSSENSRKAPRPNVIYYTGSSHLGSGCHTAKCDACAQDMQIKCERRDFWRPATRCLKARTCPPVNCLIQFWPDALPAHHDWGFEPNLSGAKMSPQQLHCGYLFVKTINWRMCALVNKYTGPIYIHT